MGMKARTAAPARWGEETETLREILTGCGLSEERKWGQPCFVHDDNNIAIIQSMKGFLSLMFFKGALLKDDTGLLVEQGPNTRSAKRLELTSVDEIRAVRSAIERLVRQAIAVEKAGLKVDEPRTLELPAELEARFARDRKLEKAFKALTPGRQRGYCLYFAAPVHSETRVRRIDKYADKILAGKGFHDR